MAELNQIEAEGVVYDLRDDGAVRQDQGTENAGKALVIGNNGKVTPGKAGGTDRVSVTLSASGWTAGTSYAFEQAVTISGVTAGTDFDADCALSGTDDEADGLVQDAFGLVPYAVSQAGGIKFCAAEQPDVNIPLTIRLYA